MTGEIELLLGRLRRYNDWRRGADIEQPNPTELGRDIDRTVELMASMEEAIRLTVSENKHLADGADCTLHRLVEVIGGGRWLLRS
ncbi:MAG: hypothetical protein CMI09_09370 [Oceanospirillaceae bacterium]|nr:hypothetical protein [Oceanospirillaceae bacterium]